MNIRMGRTFCALKRRYNEGWLVGQEAVWKSVLRLEFGVKKEMPSFILVSFMIK